MSYAQGAPQSPSWDFGGYRYGLEPLYLPPVFGSAAPRPAQVGSEPAGSAGAVGEATDNDVAWFRWITGHQAIFAIWTLLGRVVSSFGPGGPSRAELDTATLLVNGYSGLMSYACSCDPHGYDQVIRPAMYRHHHGFSGQWAPDYAAVGKLFHGRRPPQWLHRPSGRRLRAALSTNHEVHVAVAGRLVPGSGSLLQQHAVNRNQDRIARADLFDLFFLTVRADVDAPEVHRQFERRLQACLVDVRDNGAYLVEPGPRGDVLDYGDGFGDLVRSLISTSGDLAMATRPDPPSSRPSSIPVANTEAAPTILLEQPTMDLVDGLGRAYAVDDTVVLAAAMAAALPRVGVVGGHVNVLDDEGWASADATDRPSWHTLLTNASVTSGPMSADTEAGAVTLRLHRRSGNLAQLVSVDGSLPVAQWDALLRCLLADAADRPEVELSELRLQETALGRLQAEAAARRADEYPVPTMELLHTGFERVAAADPDRIALVTDSGSVTYGTLHDRAVRFAARLRSSVGGIEGAVAVQTGRGESQVVTLLAASMAGAAFVPLDSRLPASRIAVMLRDARCTVVVGADEESSVGESLPEGVRIITVPGQLAAGPYPPLPSPSPENTAFIHYTSGSTGEPKGVDISHRNAAARVEWIVRRYNLGVDSVVLHKTPLIFDVAVIEVFAALSAGGRIRVVGPGSEYDIGYLAEVLGCGEVAFVHFVPSMLKAFLNGVRGKTFSGVRAIQTSGEALPAWLVEEAGRVFPEAVLDSAYGQTETSEVAVWRSTDRLPAESAPTDAKAVAVPIGEAIAAYRILLLDSAAHVVPTGVMGEICVAGVGGLARGYHRRPAETAARFVPNPYSAVPGERLYRTGDLGVRRSSDGPIEFVGRADQQVKIRGARVEIGEIEAALRRAPDVLDAVVDVRQDSDGDSEVVAYVEVAPGGPRTGEQMSSEQVRQHLAERLPAYMVPSVVVVLPSLPLTASGKLDRAALPSPQPRATSTNTELAQSELERELAKEWATRLGVEMVERTESFFDLGGSSLKAAQMLVNVSTLFGVRLSAVAFFADPTLRGVAKEVERLVLESVEELSQDEVQLRVATKGGGRGRS